MAYPRTRVAQQHLVTQLPEGNYRIGSCLSSHYGLALLSNANSIKLPSTAQCNLAVQLVPTKSFVQNAPLSLNMKYITN